MYDFYAFFSSMCLIISLKTWSVSTPTADDRDDGIFSAAEDLLISFFDTLSFSTKEFLLKLSIIVVFVSFAVLSIIAEMLFAQSLHLKLLLIIDASKCFSIKITNLRTRKFILDNSKRDISYDFGLEFTAPNIQGSMKAHVSIRSILLLLQMFSQKDSIISSKPALCLMCHEVVLRVQEDKLPAPLYFFSKNLFGYICQMFKDMSNSNSSEHWPLAKVLSSISFRTHIRSLQLQCNGGSCSLRGMRLLVVRSEQILGQGKPKVVKLALLYTFALFIQSSFYLFLFLQLYQTVAVQAGFFAYAESLQAYA